MGAVYLIALNQPLVAQDVAMTLLDHDPHAEIIRCEDAEQAITRIAAAGAIEAAFIAADPDSATSIELFDVLSAHAARIVLMGDRAEEKAASLPWTVLHRPFTSFDVISLLAPRV